MCIVCMVIQFLAKLFIKKTLNIFKTIFGRGEESCLSCLRIRWLVWNLWHCYLFYNLYIWKNTHVRTGWRPIKNTEKTKINIKLKPRNYPSFYFIKHTYFNSQSIKKTYYNSFIFFSLSNAHIINQISGHSCLFKNVYLNIIWKKIYSLIELKPNSVYLYTIVYFKK